MYTLHVFLCSHRLAGCGRSFAAAAGILALIATAALVIGGPQSGDSSEVVAADVLCGAVLWATVLGPKFTSASTSPSSLPSRWVDVWLDCMLALTTLFAGGCAIATGITSRTCSHTAWTVDLAQLVIATCLFGVILVLRQCFAHRDAKSSIATSISAIISTRPASGKNATVSPVPNGSGDSGVRSSPLQGAPMTITSTPMVGGSTKPLRLLIPFEAMGSRPPQSPAGDSWVHVPKTPPAYPYANGQPVVPASAYTSIMSQDVDAVARNNNGPGSVSLNMSSIDADARSVSAKSVLSASVHFAGELDGANVSPVAASPATHSASRYAIPLI